jgi:ATP-dependent Clp protease ATP-binding subunit ClpC
MKRQFQGVRGKAFQKMGVYRREQIIRRLVPAALLIFAAGTGAFAPAGLKPSVSTQNAELRDDSSQMHAFSATSNKRGQQFGRGASSTTAVRMMFERMSEPLINALVTAQNESARLNLKDVDVECMLLGIVDHPQNVRVTLQKYGISFRQARATLEKMYKEIEGDTSSSSSSSSWGSMLNLNKKARDVDLPFANPLKRALTNSVKLADKMESETVNSEHVLLCLFDYNPATNKSETEEEGDLDFAVGAHAVILRMDSVDSDSFSKTEFCRTLIMDMKNPSNQSELVGVGGGGSETPTLNEIGIDMTEMARNYQLDPVFGRETEVYMSVRTLLRRRKNNPCLIGEPGE